MNSEVAAALRDILRVGEVVSTNPENCTARVQFKDTDDLISGDLHILFPKIMRDKFYWLPDIGEAVLCVFLGNGPIAGFVLGSYYNFLDEPKEESQDVTAIQFEDDTLVRYDRDEHKLEIIVKGDVDVYIEKDKKTQIDGNVNIEAGIDINAKATGNVNVDASEANFDCPAVNLGTGANMGVVHEKSPCPLYGIFHLLPSQTTRTAV
jgi:phage baseplate assembly protein V